MGDDRKKKLVAVVIFSLSFATLITAGSVSYKSPSSKVRGFFVSDPGLAHVELPSTFPSYAISITELLGCASVLAFSWYCRPESNKYDKVNTFFVYVCFFSLAWLFTNLGKAFVAELRPDYIASCNPQVKEVFIPNTGTSAYGAYVTSHSCTINDPDDHLSFISGHASLFTYQLLGLQLHMIMYVWPYLSGIYPEQQIFIRMGMTFANCGIVLLGFLVTSSRIRNLKHTWLNVVLGAMFGIGMCIAGIFADISLLSDVKRIYQVKSASPTQNGTAEMQPVVAHNVD